jgi:uncharacterized membrane protein
MVTVGFHPLSMVTLYLTLVSLVYPALVSLVSVNSAMVNLLSLVTFSPSTVQAKLVTGVSEFLEGLLSEK